jgi:hypothetical protein
MPMPNRPPPPIDVDADHLEGLTPSETTNHPTLDVRTQMGPKSAAASLKKANKPEAVTTYKYSHHRAKGDDLRHEVHMKPNQVDEDIYSGKNESKKSVEATRRNCA